jgi:hypothetical protein
VDRLKKSLEQLEAPICPSCNIEMSWTHSSLVDRTTIVHVFICPSCTTTTESKSTVKVTRIPPEKLSAPNRRVA